jgi:hypothetical protein
MSPLLPKSIINAILLTKGGFIIGSSIIFRIFVAPLKSSRHKENEAISPIITEKKVTSTETNSELYKYLLDRLSISFKPFIDSRGNIP